MEEGTLRTRDYDPGLARRYHLSVLVEHGLSAWCAHDLASGALRALYWCEGDALASALLPARPQSVSFVALPEWNTLVPDGALAPGAEARHLALVHGGLPSGAMRNEPVGHLGATCLYVHDDRLEHRVLDRFPNARPLPMGVLMVQAARRLATDRPLLLLHRGGDRLDVAVQHDGALQLCNTFPVQGAEDVLYFALLACDRTGHAPADTAFHLCGTHLTASERSLVGRYFGLPVPATGHAWADVSEGRTTASDHWLALTEQFACV
ncbi:MAG: DUF3822 family protein [Flavobacteriales bacterium]|jgi:hypothetical protein|nr:DUF3822 family protein [Flavobacteriales bacterium]